MTEFERLCNERWERGRARYRDAEFTHFQGDPIKEAREECLDLWNYVGEAQRQALVGPFQDFLLRLCVRVAWRLLS